MVAMFLILEVQDSERFSLQESKRMRNRSIILNLERKSDIIALLQVELVLIVLLPIALLLVVDPGDDERPDVPIAGELQEQVLSCRLLENLVELVLVDVQEGATR